MNTYLRFTANDGQEIEIKPIRIDTIGVVDGQLHIETVDEPPEVYMTDEVESVTKMRELEHPK